MWNIALFALSYVESVVFAGNDGRFSCSSGYPFIASELVNDKSQMPAIAQKYGHVENHSATMRKIVTLLLISGFWLLCPGPVCGRGNFPACTNDLPCDAIDLGVLADGKPLGDPTAGLYDNTCGSNTGEPNPYDKGSWYNAAGVWFRFTTGPNPTSLILIEGRSDPGGSGDPVDLELAVYRSFSGNCSGTLLFEGGISEAETPDGHLLLYCPRPNTTYFVLVDGALTAPGMEHGTFGLGIREIQVTEAADIPCRAVNLGAVPPGGQVATTGPQGNFCATSYGDPSIRSFATQVTVWFQFQAPPSGHVLISGISDGLPYPLGVQLALVQSSDGRCTGRMSEVASRYTDADLNEQLEVSCLDPGGNYFVLVDGFGSGGRGMFTFSVADAGENTPITQIDTVLCAGESLQVGTSVYTRTGTYADTLSLPTGCDSIVLTNLTVLEPLVPVINQYETAVWNGAPGAAQAGALGGAGGYLFSWCDGTSGAQNTALAAGSDCCLTVTDSRGCRVDTCLRVAFKTEPVPDFTSLSTRCFADSSGQITLAVRNGIAPYRVQWANKTGLLQGNGVLAADRDSFSVNGLPAGVYQFTVSDAFGDTTFQVEVKQPEELRFASVRGSDITCFAACDGRLDVQMAGGTGSFRYTWADGGPSLAQRGGLCAGNYALTVSDANGCRTSDAFTLVQPPEFIAIAREEQPVSCFAGADGRAVVTTNGQPYAYRWSTGADGATVTNLAAGPYSVTVTNADGCQASSRVVISQPEAPLSVRVDVERPISCYGASDGQLSASVSGPYEQLTLRWTNGISDIDPLRLAAGLYRVIATNEKGCRAERNFLLAEPEPIQADPVARDITCLDPENGGEIRIPSVSGGKSGYQFSLNGGRFQELPVFTGLYPGFYTVTVKDQAGCEQSFEAEVAGPPDLFVDLGADKVIQLGDSIALEARSNSSHLIYRWSPAAIRPADNVSTMVVRPLLSTAYRVEVSDTVTFCTAEDVVHLTVRKDRKVFVPNAFSPNGDNVNDRLVVFGGTGTELVQTFRVFSRDGALVYEAKDFLPNDENRGWDGVFRGRDLPVGVYVYLAEITFIDGETEIFRGEVVLMR